MVTSTQIALAAGALFAGYAIYFDQRRQRDPEFRRRLRHERQLARKMQEQDQNASAGLEEAAVKAAMEALGLNDDKIPETEAEKQAYLTRNLQLGEQFLNQGPSHFKLAATCLFRALKVYPDPIKLLMAFQESVPPPVLDLIMQMMAAETPGAGSSSDAPKEEKIQEILD
ncbi:TOMM20-like protein 1 [Chytriomyces hyalinus]|nr:TOMM20-like protein 1 [Chytriomyces hyalinus]